MARSSTRAHMESSLSPCERCTEREIKLVRKVCTASA